MAEEKKDETNIFGEQEKHSDVDEKGVDPVLLKQKLQQLQLEQSEILDETPAEADLVGDEEEEVEKEELSEVEEYSDETDDLGSLLYVNIQVDKEDSPVDEELSSVEEDDRNLIYGNVKLIIPNCNNLIRDGGQGADLNDHILKTYCMKSISEIHVDHQRLHLDVESVWWNDLNCPRCPGDFNCTCNRNIEDVVTKLISCFDLLVIADNRCSVCLKILEHVRQRNLIFCQLNINEKDNLQLICKLKAFIQSNHTICAKTVHHWSHESNNEDLTDVTILGEKVELPLSDYVDIIVIGTNSASIAMCQAAKSCFMNVCVIHNESGRSSSILGFNRTHYAYEGVLKKYFMETCDMQESLKQAQFFTFNESQEVTFDWKLFRINGNKKMDTAAWLRRSAFIGEGVLYVNGLPKIVDRNTVNVTTRNGPLTFRGKYIVLATECKFVYERFAGLRRYCYKMHKILSYKTIELSKTLVYGCNVSAIEFATIFQIMGFHVTLMVNSKIHEKYDEDMMNTIIGEFENSGGKYVRECRLISVIPVPRGLNGAPAIPNVSENYMIIAQFVETEKYYRDYFDNVIVIPQLVPNVRSVKGLDDVGIKFAKHNPQMTKVDKNYRTNVSNIYAIGNHVPGLQDPAKPIYELGRRLAQSLAKNENICQTVDTMYNVVIGPVPYAFYGPSEKIARRLYGSLNVYHKIYEPLDLALIPYSLKKPAYMKLICINNQISETKRRETVIGLQVIGYKAFEIVQGYALTISEGITKDDLDNITTAFGCCAQDVASIDTLKKEDEDMTALRVGCSFCE